MKSFFHFIADIIFPSSCVSCGGPVPYSMNSVCPDCLGLMRKLENGCPVCSGSLSEGVCSICSGRKFYPSAHISLFNYEKVSKTAIHALKFQRVKHLHKIFIPHICSRMNDFDCKIDIITSVPMNRKKLIKRGYNQSKLLAAGVSRKTGIKFCEVLIEKANTVQQRNLNYNERFINVIDRYETVNNTKFRDKVILIIDDVFTTGATINECSRKLVSSGAAKVFSITVVRADLKKLEII